VAIGDGATIGSRSRSGGDLGDHAPAVPARKTRTTSRRRIRPGRWPA